MTVWYNPQRDEIRIQLRDWLLFEIEDLQGYLHFVPKSPWKKNWKILMTEEDLLTFKNMLESSEIKEALRKVEKIILGLRIFGHAIVSDPILVDALESAGFKREELNAFIKEIK